MIAQRMFVDIWSLFGLEFEKLIWPVLFANIDLNCPFTFGIERTATVKVCVFLFGGLIGVTFGSEQLRFEATADELSNGFR